ncbi:hypothetical protein [Allofournierella sp.]|uniref:hypothetical protein n=1 Tax=Allofournierella sp. TaxID=1940256 RepID=UPI003AB3F95A
MENNKKLLRSTVICNMISMLLFVVWAQGINQRDYMRIFAWTKLVIYPLAGAVRMFCVLSGNLAFDKTRFSVSAACRNKMPADGGADPYSDLICTAGGQFYRPAAVAQGHREYPAAQL